MILLRLHLGNFEHEYRRKTTYSKVNTLSGILSREQGHTSSVCVVNRASPISVTVAMCACQCVCAELIIAWI